MLAGTSDVSGVALNVGGGSSVTLDHALDLIAREVGFDPARTYGITPRGDARNTRADLTKDLVADRMDAENAAVGRDCQAGCLAAAVVRGLSRPRPALREARSPEACIARVRRAPGIRGYGARPIGIERLRANRPIVCVARMPPSMTGTARVKKSLSALPTLPHQNHIGVRIIIARAACAM